MYRQKIKKLASRLKDEAILIKDSSIRLAVHHGQQNLLLMVSVFVVLGCRNDGAEMLSTISK